MRNVKIVLGLIVLAILGLLFYQNNAYFLTRHALGLDFYVAAYRFPEIANGLFFLGCLLIGMLLAYFSSLAYRFEAKRTIGELTTAIQGHQAAIAALQNELDAVKRGASGSQQPSETGDPVDPVA